MEKSASGSGRGRGWMKLNNSEVTRPGVVAPSELENSMDKITMYLNLDETSDCSQYSKLIEAIEQIDTKDDSIILSRKVKQVKKVWLQLCKNGNEVSDSFFYVYSKCLSDTSLATKFVAVISLPPFDRVLHEQKLVVLLVKCLQYHYDERIALQKDHPEAFRSFVQMMGEFFHKAKGRSNSIDRLLREPNLVCLEMLLTSAQEADLCLFTTLLNLIASSEPKTVTSLLTHVRELLIKEANLTTVSKTWLLLTLDLANCRFGLLPNEIHKFYEDKLGENEMSNFQSTHSSLSIEILQPNKAFDSYKSSVNVLQVTPESAPLEQTNSQNNGQASTDPKRLGRPILGVGVRDQSTWDKWE